MHNNLQKFQDYLLKEKNYSVHTALAYGKDLEFFQQFLDGNFDKTALEEVSYTLVRSWIVFMVDAGVSNSSVNRKMSSLKSFYKFLLKTKQIEVSPLSKHKALKTPKKVQIPFSEDELDNVLTHVVYKEGFDGVRDKLVIEMFYSTGIRRSELIGLQLKNVDLSGGQIKVLGKRQKERIVPLLPLMIDQLKLYLDERKVLKSIVDADFLFLLSNGNKLNETFVYRLINDYFSNVSEKVKRSPHMLRHTFATHMLNHGADLNSIKELLGHSSLASTQVYTHSSLTELKNVYQSAHPRNQK
ncbi:tyrosine-type recombinase/integrase [Flavobacterium amniphilum]|uniref:tyrosine-type recombinase/integrase n=1 Tax=Flavobacterium amniphilum TaxID=1834035 RepID=UPI002029FA41|nr:tyrosine-type recombinase/integrase [Flavobacterium amniphilum]MCL9807330.1 tyrosine-type recombinase/integrase [Flavobacterium amniphilum]